MFSTFCILGAGDLGLTFSERTFYNCMIAYYRTGLLGTVEQAVKQLWPAAGIRPEVTVSCIRALASARGSVSRWAQKQRRQPLEGPKGPRVAETRESEGPKGPRTSKAQSPFWRLPVLLYVFHNSAQNRDF